MSFILLPVLPDEAIDRWGAINPYGLWLLTVLIGVVSFVGYVAVRLVGFRRGVAVAGMAGGLASSTAATAAISRLAAEHPDQMNVLAAGAIFANAVMAPRVLAILSLVNPDFALRLAAPLVAIGLVYFLAGGALMWRGAHGARWRTNPLRISNPLDLPSVLKFGALLAAVMVLAKIVTRFAGSSGVYALALISGIADVDAISLTMARQAPGNRRGAAAIAVLLAIFSNTIVKAGSWGLGGGPWDPVLRDSALALGAGLAALVFSHAAGPLVMRAAPTRSVLLCHSRQALSSRVRRRRISSARVRPWARRRPSARRPCRP